MCTLHKPANFSRSIQIELRLDDIEVDAELPVDFARETMFDDLEHYEAEQCEDTP